MAARAVPSTETGDPRVDKLDHVSDTAPKELWGGETAKAVENFPVSGETMPVPVVRWLGRIKAAAARVNTELGLLDPELAERIAAAADRSPRASSTTSSRSTSSRPAPAPRRT